MHQQLALSSMTIAGCIPVAAIPVAPRGGEARPGLSGSCTILPVVVMWRLCKTLSRWESLDWRGKWSMSMKAKLLRAYLFSWLPPSSTALDVGTSNWTNDWIDDWTNIMNGFRGRGEMEESYLLAYFQHVISHPKCPPLYIHSTEVLTCHWLLGKQHTTTCHAVCLISTRLPFALQWTQYSFQPKY